jgi:UDP-N-acetylmuramoyl-tripeptide--D-alanyl-D-alanine ligase
VDPAALPADRALLEVKSPLAALTALAEHHRARLRARVIAVTGSTGKTTTKELLHWLLGWTRQGTAAPASFNNLLGVALTLLAAQPDDDYVVAEVGTSAPGEILTLGELVRPDIAVITCVGPTHLEGLGSVEEVAREKSRLLQTLRPGGVAVLAADDPLVAEMPVPEGIEILTFGCEDGMVRGRVIESGLAGLELSVEGVDGLPRLQAPLLGRHNATNLLAAMAAARAHDPRCLVPERWSSFQGPPHRMQVLTSEGVTFLNDAYNANPLSMRAALETLADLPADGGRIAVLGEMRELGSSSLEHHRQVGAVAAHVPLDGLLTVGAGARGIAEGAQAAGLAPDRIWQAGGLPQAQALLADLTGQASGQLVLLKASRAVGLERLLP